MWKRAISGIYIVHSDTGMHHGTCVTHVPWCMAGSQITTLITTHTFVASYMASIANEGHIVICCIVYNRVTYVMYDKCSALFFQRKLYKVHCILQYGDPPFMIAHDIYYKRYKSYVLKSFAPGKYGCNLVLRSFNTHINSFWSSDTIWRQRTGSTLAQVIVYCLTAPNHYLNQCLTEISEV